MLVGFGGITTGSSRDIRVLTDKEEKYCEV